MEIFKTIPGYENYKASNIGNIKSISRMLNNNRGSFLSKEYIFKSHISCHGYLLVNLDKDGKKKCFGVHQLVAMAFLNHKPNGHKIVVDHIDNNKLNNTLENLQLISQRQNTSKDRKGYTSKYIGVFWQKDAKKWRSDISINGKTKYLGLFKTEVEATGAKCVILNQGDSIDLSD